MKADQLQWGPTPGLPAGIDTAVLFGNPAEEGLFIMRGRMADGTVVPPHWHSNGENITVLSGTFHLGMGDSVDGPVETLGPGDFFAMAPEMRHFVRVEGETIIEVVGMGPFDINYVNPADAPPMPAPAN